MHRCHVLRGLAWAEQAQSSRCARNWPGGQGPPRVSRVQARETGLQGTLSKYSGFYFTFAGEVTKYHWGGCFSYYLCNKYYFPPPSPFPTAIHKGVFVLCKFKVSSSNGGERTGDYEEEAEFYWLSEQKYGRHQGFCRERPEHDLQAAEAVRMVFQCQMREGRGGVALGPSPTGQGVRTLG